MKLPRWLVAVVCLLAAGPWLGGAAARAQDSPVDALVGQTMRACSVVEEPLDVVVEQAEWRPGPNGSQLVVLQVRLTNLGTRPAVPYRATLLRDERGRQYEQAIASSGVEINSLATERGVQPPTREIAPGGTATTVWAFLVPPEVQTLGLASNVANRCSPTLGSAPLPSATTLPVPLAQGKPRSTLSPGYTVPQARLYGSAENPVPPGSVADVGGGWRLRVGDVLLNANNLVLDANPNNPPVAPDAQDVLVYVTATYLGPPGTSASGQDLNAGLRLVGPAGQVYATDSCGLGPDPLAAYTLAAGETATGTVCWQVRAADVGSLLLVYAPDPSYQPLVYFSLPASFY